MRSDYPDETRGLHFFVWTTFIAALGMIGWIAVAHPLSGNESPETVRVLAPK